MSPSRRRRAASSRRGAAASRASRAQVASHSERLAAAREGQGGGYRSPMARKASAISSVRAGLAAASPSAAAKACSASSMRAGGPAAAEGIGGVPTAGRAEANSVARTAATSPAPARANGGPRGGRFRASARTTSSMRARAIRAHSRAGRLFRVDRPSGAVRWVFVAGEGRLPEPVGDEERRRDRP